MPLLVLVVEDDPDVAALLRMILEHTGYAVQSAATVAEAQRVLRERPPPALVLLDLVLPDGDGLEVCETIRRHWPLLPVLVVTARADPAVHGQAAAAGCSEVILKPFDPDALLSRVQARIGIP